MIANRYLFALGLAENLPSPCISVCQMDKHSGLCAGCLRTLDEIACWSALSDADKRAVWTLIGQRMARRQEPAHEAH